MNNITKTLLPILLALTAGSAACAGPRARLDRGAIATRDTSPRLVARGPVTLLAHTQEKGGKLFLVEDDGTQSPCARVGAGDAEFEVALQRDRRNKIRIPEGYAGCLIAGQNRFGYELLWFAKHDLPETEAAGTQYAQGR